MANNYKFAFFDAQLILVRTIKALSPRSPEGIVKREDVMRTFLYSIFKVVREKGVDRPVLLWDSSPYHKKDILESFLPESHYKADRWIQEDIGELKDKIAQLGIQIDSLRGVPESEEQIAKLEKEIANINQRIKNQIADTANFEIRQDIKYYFINELGKYGMSSVIKKGWEADDIAYLYANLVKPDPRKSLVVTTDTDWEYWINDNVDKYNNYSGIITTAEEVRKRHEDVLSKFPEWDLFKLKMYLDVCYGSHNNLYRTLNEKSKGKKLWEILDNLDEYIEDKNMYDAQLATWDFTRYPDYDFMSNSLDWYLKEGAIASREDYHNFLKTNKIGMNPEKYREFVSYLNPNLYNYVN